MGNVQAEYAPDPNKAKAGNSREASGNTPARASQTLPASVAVRLWRWAVIGGLPAGLMTV